MPTDTTQFVTYTPLAYSNFLRCDSSRPQCSRRASATTSTTSTLQIADAAPRTGPVITGSGGLRKIRWALPGSGKRGGLRIIYYWARTERAFYMVYAYSKSEQGDFTAAQTRELGRLVRQEFK